MKASINFLKNYIPDLKVDDKDFAERLTMSGTKVESFKKLESKKIPKNIDYNELKNLRLEARQKLNKIKPENVGQAARIMGVSPADIAVLLVYLKK